MANIRRSLYKVRSSYLNQAKHQNDSFLNLGYDYRGKILRNGTSDELWANPLQISIFGKLEAMITFILEESKMIKRMFSFAHDKNDLKIN